MLRPFSSLRPTFAAGTLLLTMTVTVRGQEEAPPIPQERAAAEETPKIPLEITVREVGRPPDRTVVVQTVVPRGIGYRMGIVPGDVILRVNGKKVDSLQRLRQLIRTDEATFVWKAKAGSEYFRNTVSLYGDTKQIPLPPKPVDKRRSLRVSDMERQSEPYDDTMDNADVEHADESDVP